MQSFISEVVDALITAQHPFSDSVIIVPSRRAGVVFRDTLSRKLKQTLFSPSIYSIEEFISHVSGLKTIDSTEQLFTFYQVYQAATPKDQQESFATFCGWAQTVLHDFNEIDRFLVDHKQCFNYLSAIQQIESHWSVNAQGSSLVANYLNFWNRLPEYYELFTQALQKQNKGHQGLAYRKAAEDIEFYIQNNPSQTHVFLGFNALNAAEQQIIQALLATGNTRVYWDIDAFFLNNPKHEAGMFIRSYFKQWSYYNHHEPKWVSDLYSEAKKITVAAINQTIAQAKYVGNLLAQRSKEDLEETAIVLSDEQLLLPILNALPEQVTAVNITMGIPLGQTPVASFFDALFRMHKKETPRGYYYKHILAIVQHPLMLIVAGETAKAIAKHIERENLIYMAANAIKALFSKTPFEALADILFDSWQNDPGKAISQALACIDRLKDTLLSLKDTATHSLTIEYLFGFYKAFNSLKNLNDSYAYIKDLPTLYRFYLDTIAAETLDLRGDPHRGLQIMGMLESRVLNFKHVILTSVNEGVLPAGKSTNSFLPYDVKLTYNLPTYQEKDAVYSYHFYHLLHRAKTAHLLYTTQSEGIGVGEKSRFIRQLEIEGPHKLDQTIATASFQIPAVAEKVIEKTPEMMKQLASLAGSGFSPSSLSTYLRNPVDFYYKYVLGIKESDVVEETVAANTMGTIVHNTMETLYTPYLNQILNKDSIQSLHPLITQTVAVEFEKAYGTIKKLAGKNLIIKEVICRYIENYLNLELANLKKGDQVIIKGLEQRLSSESGYPGARLKGTVDLIEERNGRLQIVDYKTGKTKSGDLKIKSWEDLLTPEGKYEKAFQVLTYVYMLNKNSSLSFPVSAGITSFKNLKEGFLPFAFKNDTAITQETLAAYEQQLHHLISEILDPEVPFKAV